MKERKVYLDILKIISCIGVIYIHTCGQLVDSSVISATYIAGLLLFFIAKTAVPIFFMVAGANLMRRNESIKDSVIRALKMILVLLLVSIAYYIYYNGRRPDLIEYLRFVYTGEAIGILWYLYVYIGILCMLPVIRSFKPDRKVYVYFFGVWMFINALLPFLAWYFGIKLPNELFYITFFNTHLVCFFLGDFLENEIEEKHYTKKKLFSVIILFVLAIVVSLLCVLYELKRRGSTMLVVIYGEESYITSFIISICIFYFVKYFSKNNNISLKLKKFTEWMVKYTFGIYLVHFLFIMYMQKQFIYLKTNINMLAGILVFDVIILVLSFVVVFIAKCIPGIKRLI